MVQMIGWALLHSVWQAGVIAALTAFTLYLMRNASAAARYWVAVGGMVLLVAMPMATVAGSGSGSPPMQVRGTQLRGTNNDERVTNNEQRVTSARENAASTASPKTNNPRLESRSPSPSSPISPDWRGRLEAALPWIVMLWLLGVILLSIRMIAGLRWARRLTREGTRPVSDQLRGAAARIADAMGVRVAVRVLESTRVTVPMLVGWMRPVILMPASLFSGLMPQQIEAILAHELAHVRRHDYAVNLLQTVVETLFFFHPAAWWLSDRIREERENACDELAVAACGGDRVFYSRVLLTVEESRGNVPALAVAASGGSLSRRIYRLLGAQQAHLDIGPRWYAGVFTIALAVVTAGGVFDAKGLTADTSASAFMGADTSGARPDTVIRYTGNGDLNERWTWASDVAKRSRYNQYWVGYLIDGDENSPNWLYIDRHSPVRIGSTITSGSMRMGKDYSGARFAGTPLSKVLGNEESHRIVVFMRYDGGQVTRLHVSSYVFPMNFEEVPVLWLGRTTDVQSIERLVRVDGETRDPDLREDVTSAIGAHTDAAAAVPVLEKWAQDRSRPEDVRKEAVESLAYQRSPSLLGFLAHIARSDDSEDVRAEAVEAIGDITDPAAFDTLKVFVHSLRADRLQREAIEGLANAPGDRGLKALQEILDDRTLSSDIRREAVEELADRSDSADMLKTLVGYASRPDDQDVQRRAVEAIGNIHGDDTERVKALVDIVENHPDTDIQGKAAEALGEVESHELALRELTRIAKTHRSEDVRRHAMEALGTFTEDDRGGKVLLDIARTHPYVETRRRAVEFLGNYHDYPIINEVAAIALADDQADDVRRKAVETYMDVVPARDAVVFARKVLAGSASEDVKRKVLESLGSLDDGAGIQVIIETIRTSKDAEIRRRALEALIDSDDPRAIAALRKVQ